MFIELRKCAIAAVMVAMCVSVASADFIDFSGGATSIPNNSLGGVNSVINVTTDEIISDLSVTIFDFRHTWVGDLTARIISPNGTSADLFVRPLTNLFFYGDSSDLRGDYTFIDGGDDFTAEAASRGSNSRLRNRDYQASTTNGTPVSLAAMFAGESTVGAWTLFLSDTAIGDIGSIDGWGLSFTSTPAPVASVPEPSSLIYFGLAGTLMLRRRRRRSVVVAESETES
ncbi:proprotein convertase P-domain-containing protein [Stieleria varia]|uniref:Proprotein convertase P-domain protein n=1 Tax=Stieleria varia TaxID=2528005 RepID=A0A5C6B1U6_9BACT|nr:proprotein convertase P-domain-containing protein [Stieleria varia]TWU05870.1 Proprotein convertase P-domain protein [Stieleria varia]